MRWVWTTLLAWLALLPAVPASAEQVVEIATGEWPPYTSATAPGFGLHAQRVERVLAAAGYRVQFRFLPWNRAYARTVVGEYPATFSWYRNGARVNELLFPETPIAVVGINAYYTRSRFPNGLRAESLEDLAAQGLKFVGVESYWYARELKALSAEVEFVPEGRMVWRMLESGRADIAIEATEVAQADVERELGPGRFDGFATTGAVKLDPLFIVFSRKSEIGAELMRAWDAYAGKVP